MERVRWWVGTERSWRLRCCHVFLWGRGRGVSGVYGGGGRMVFGREGAMGTGRHTPKTDVRNMPEILDRSEATMNQLRLCQQRR